MSPASARHYLRLSVLLLLVGSALPAAIATTETAVGQPIDSTAVIGPPNSSSQVGVASADPPADTSDDEPDAAPTDTDGDGYADAVEARCEKALRGADPQRQDLYVEIDATGSQRLDPATLAAVTETFANAPITNPDGSTGITLHIEIDDTTLGSNGTVYSSSHRGADNDIGDYRTQHFDRGHGYYVLLTNEVAHSGDEHYVGTGRPGVAALERLPSSSHTASLFMHELGHAMGLDPGKTGIDDRRYSAEEYASVMNYNGLYDTLSYSTGKDSVGRDEWQFVAQQRTSPSPIPLANQTCSNLHPAA